MDYTQSIYMNIKLIWWRRFDDLLTYQHSKINSSDSKRLEHASILFTHWRYGIWFMASINFIARLMLYITQCRCHNVSYWSDGAMSVDCTHMIISSFYAKFMRQFRKPTNLKCKNILLFMSTDGLNKLLIGFILTNWNGHEC